MGLLRLGVTLWGEASPFFTSANKFHRYIHEKVQTKWLNEPITKWLNSINVKMINVLASSLSALLFAMSDS